MVSTRAQSLSECSRCAFARGTFMDEKRRYDARVQQLEEELEEERTTSDLNVEKLKKLAMSYEQTLADIAAEKSNNEKLEVGLRAAKEMRSANVLFAKIIVANLERQIQEFRKKLESNDGSVNESLKSRVVACETKIHAYEEQLDNEIR